MKDYKKYFTITAKPWEIYLALTTEATIELWTGDKAEMQELEGSEFSLWDGSIVGVNLQFEKDKKIVQRWYFGDQQEVSIVTIKLHPHKIGTSVELNHTNIPEEDYDDIVAGWNEDYFGSLRDFYTGE